MVNVMMLCHSAGFEHSYLPNAEVTVKELARESGLFSATTTRRCDRINAEKLAATDVLIFATTGELPFDDEQKRLILDFVRGGKGFLGIHNAADTLYQWPEYGEMVGGYFKGKTDRVFSILTDSLLAFPAIVIAALIVGRFDALAASDTEFLGMSFGWLNRRWSVAIVFSLLSIAPVSRIVRAQTLSLSEREYVLAARSLGARTPRVLTREIFPNLIPAMLSVIFTGIAILLAAEGGLAFIGYSVKPPEASWGLMIAEARSKIDVAWWATMMPAFVLFMTVLAFNLIGDWFARRFDIREASL